MIQIVLLVYMPGIRFQPLKLLREKDRGRVKWTKESKDNKKSQSGYRWVEESEKAPQQKESAQTTSMKILKKIYLGLATRTTTSTRAISKVSTSQKACPPTSALRSPSPKMPAANPQVKFRNQFRVLGLCRCPAQIIKNRPPPNNRPSQTKSWCRALTIQSLRKCNHSQ